MATKNKICWECGTPLTGKQQKWHSERCRAYFNKRVADKKEQWEIGNVLIGPPHEFKGMPCTIKGGLYTTRVEAEGGEYRLHHVVLDDPTERTFTGTPHQILTQISATYSGPPLQKPDKCEFHSKDKLIKKDAVFSDHIFTIRGTNDQIGSMINLLYGGVEWDKGAKLIAPFTTEALEKGIQVEMKEHYNENGDQEAREKAAKTAADHLRSDPNYYYSENRPKDTTVEDHPKENENTQIMKQGGPMSDAQNKFDYVMHEWKLGNLKHGTTGETVGYPDQQDMALAIAFSEAQRIDPNFNKMENGGPVERPKKIELQEVNLRYGGPVKPQYNYTTAESKRLIEMAGKSEQSAIEALIQARYYLDLFRKHRDEYYNGIYTAFLEEEYQNLASDIASTLSYEPQSSVIYHNISTGEKEQAIIVNPMSEGRYHIKTGDDSVYAWNYEITPIPKMKEGGPMYTGSQVSRQIKKELRLAFPKIKFSVTYESYSGGDSVSIRWNFGPTTDQVEAITNKYQAGYFNSMEDIYEYETQHVVDQEGNLRDLGGVKFVHTRREYELNNGKTHNENYQDETDARTEVAKYLSENYGYEWEGRDTKMSGATMSIYQNDAGSVLAGNAFDTSEVQSIDGIIRTAVEMGTPGNQYKIEYDKGKITENPNAEKALKQEEEWEESLKQKEIEDLQRFEQEAERLKEYEKAVASMQLRSFGVEKRVRMKNVEFPTFNKNNTLSEYEEELQKDKAEEKDIRRATEIAQIIIANDRDWNILTNNFLEDFSQVWKNVGSTGVDTEILTALGLTEEDFQLGRLTEEQWDAIRPHLYTIATLLFNEETGAAIIIDTQGYDYARYVGFPADKSEVEEVMLNLKVKEKIEIDLGEKSEVDIAKARARAKIKVLQLKKSQKAKKKAAEEKKKIKGDLLASSSTKEGIIALIAEYWYGRPGEYELKKTDENHFDVYGPRGKKDNVRVIKQGDKYRFESIVKSMRQGGPVEDIHKGDNLYNVGWESKTNMGTYLLRADSIEGAKRKFESLPENKGKKVTDVTGELTGEYKLY